MPGFRVTKYDPVSRLANGSYERDEWTSVSDIGRMYGGATVTVDVYRKAEDAYVESVHRFMASAGVRELRVSDLELRDHADALPDAIRVSEPARPEALYEGCVVSGAALSTVVRLALRERLWCRLEGDHAFYVHFGYDFYMYIGHANEAADVPPLPDGMYAEPLPSPYHREVDGDELACDRDTLG